MTAADYVLVAAAPFSAAGVFYLIYRLFRYGLQLAGQPGLPPDRCKLIFVFTIIGASFLFGAALVLDSKFVVSSATPRAPAAPARVTLPPPPAASMSQGQHLSGLHGLRGVRCAASKIRLEARLASR